MFNQSLRHMDAGHVSFSCKKPVDIASSDLTHMCTNSPSNITFIIRLEIGHA